MRRGTGHRSQPPQGLLSGTRGKQSSTPKESTSVDDEREHLGHESAKGRLVRAEGRRAQEVERLVRVRVRVGVRVRVRVGVRVRVRVGVRVRVRVRVSTTSAGVE